MPDKAARRLSKALRCHLVRVLAEIGCGENALELLPHQLLACGVVTAPHAERLDKPRRGCRIDRIESDDLVSEKHIAGAGWIVKAHLVAL